MINRIYDEELYNLADIEAPQSENFSASFDDIQELSNVEVQTDKAVDEKIDEYAAKQIVIIDFIKFLSMPIPISRRPTILTLLICVLLPFRLFIRCA